MDYLTPIATHNKNIKCLNKNTVVVPLLLQVLQTCSLPITQTIATPVNKKPVYGLV